MIDITTEGVIEITQRLQKGAEKQTNNVIRRVTMFFARQARRNISESVYARSVPWRRTGKARQSIVESFPAPDRGQVNMGVKYGKNIEFGTRPHVITTNKRSLSDGKRFFGKRVNHPGSKAYPFWRPAIEQTKKQIPIELAKEFKSL